MDLANPSAVNMREMKTTALRTKVDENVVAYFNLYASIKTFLQLYGLEFLK